MSSHSTNDRGWHLHGRPLGLVLLVAYKGIWGTAEVAAGVLAVFFKVLLAKELTEDPQDSLANWLFTHVGVAEARRIGIYIILLGLIKIALAFGVWYRSWRLRKIAIAFFCALTAYGLYDISKEFTIFKLATVLIEASVLGYLWKVLPRHMRHSEIS